MSPESLGKNIEASMNASDLPKQFEGIQCKDEFINIYKNIKSRYGDNFSRNEIGLIEKSRNLTCNEYKQSFDSTKRAIAGNRIDAALFEFRYPQFINLNSSPKLNLDSNVIRKINNTNRQRKFRNVAMQLANKYLTLSDSDKKIIEEEFNRVRKMNNTAIPDFNTIDKKLQQKDKEKDSENNLNNDLNGNTLNKMNQLNGSPNENWPSKVELAKMKTMEISPFFEKIKKEVFSVGSFDEKGNGEYVEGFFMYCANEMSGKFNLNVDEDQEVMQEVLNICKDHFYAIAEGNEKSVESLVNDINQKIFELRGADACDDLLNSIHGDDKIDYSKYELTEEDEKVIDFWFNSKKRKSGGKTREQYIQDIKRYKYLEEKRAKGDILLKEEEEDFKILDEAINQAKRLKKLKRIRQNEDANEYDYEYSSKSINASVEYATGNVKDMEPIAIVENNKQINEYVYGYGEPEDDKIDKDMDIKLSLEDKKRLFKQLRLERPRERSFQYFNDDLSINRDLVDARGIDMKSVKARRREIDEILKNMALKEKGESMEKEKIKNINVRRASMVCCFRAISSFFDTVNKNGENYASEFEIEDVNKNIEFDKETGLITMEGTIGANKNHVKLYYNTQTGTLEFDNFLAYNQNEGFKIGKGNGERIRLADGTLPTMQDMESTARSANLLNFNLIDRLSGNNLSAYNRIELFAMTETIWLKHFKGLLGTKSEGVRFDVQNFNEKNILIQDIVKNIYNKFYNSKNIDELLNSNDKSLKISEGNKPEQFKLFKLIFDSIEKMDTNQLLKFRLCINKIDEILTKNPGLVEKDKLLKLLFVDDASDNKDTSDISKEIMKNENGDLSISDENDIISFKHNENFGIEGNKRLNYYIFLDLLAEDVGAERIINLDEFEAALKNIEIADHNLVDDASDNFRKNYYERYDFADQELEKGYEGQK